MNSNKRFSSLVLIMLIIYFRSINDSLYIKIFVKRRGSKICLPKINFWRIRFNFTSNVCCLSLRNSIDFYSLRWAYWRNWNGKKFIRKIVYYHLIFSVLLFLLCKIIIWPFFTNMHITIYKMHPKPRSWMIVGLTLISYYIVHEQRRA